MQWDRISDVMWFNTNKSIVKLSHGGNVLNETNNVWTGWSPEVYEMQLDIGPVIGVGADNTIWLNTPVGSAVRVVDKETGSDILTQYNPVSCPLYAELDVSDPVRSIVVDDQGGKWMIHSGYLLHFDDRGTPTETSDDLWAFHGIPTYRNWISTIFVEPQGGLWIKTQEPSRSPLTCTETLYYYEMGDIRSRFDDTWLPYLIEGQATSCFELFGPDAKGNNWIKYVDTEDVLGPYALLNDSATLLDQSDDEWVTWSEDDGAFFTASTMEMDPSDDLWIGGYLFNYGDSVLDKEDDQWWPIDSYEPSAMAVDASGGRWFGYQTYGEHNPDMTGTLRYLDDGQTPQDSADDTWMDYAEADGLPFEDIRDIQIDALNDKWILGSEADVEPQLCNLNDNGTPENKSDDTWTVYTTDDGLASPWVHAIAIEHDSGLWVGTEKGINYYQINQ